MRISSVKTIERERMRFKNVDFMVFSILEKMQGVALPPSPILSIGSHDLLNNSTLRLL